MPLLQPHNQLIEALPFHYCLHYCGYMPHSRSSPNPREISDFISLHCLYSGSKPHLLLSLSLAVVNSSLELVPLFNLLAGSDLPPQAFACLSHHDNYIRLSRGRLFLFIATTLFSTIHLYSKTETQWYPTNPSYIFARTTSPYQDPMQTPGKATYR